MGSFAALARQSYGFPHRGALLHGAPARLVPRDTASASTPAGVDAGRPRLGVVPERDHAGRATDAEPSSPAGARRRLLFYARPEAHAARNMFELGLLAISRGGRRRRHRAGMGAPRRRRRLGRPPPIDARRRRRRSSCCRAARQGAYARAAARARRRAGAHVHPPPQPRADRDGLGGNAHRDQHVREQDAARRCRDLDRT